MCDEFFKQGDYERKLHLPVTPLCDRYGTTVAKIQSGNIPGYHFIANITADQQYLNVYHLFQIIIMGPLCKLCGNCTFEVFD